ncbi:Crp/Fnr family transcriptional regulator [Fusobacterium perfoetens]|uniref:Crp/Fnr family transcriptional regulator n=1 Tax=Fusobacterium perfoetens TaxID=852 RepID=UPI000485BDD5|nr:Crp/Fnr family transcriptional regulator [Fusobacterium perfoetens]MCI6153061.1 Crp/Fnr family transcriptional regulator [Fusobacterium perfoetens]MDY3237458.1 Crp/Fnr family transcriptional regulator [Fusobacterium perfoetens]
MKDFLEIIKKSELFYSLNDKEIEILFECLQVKIKDFDKEKYIFKSGDKISEIGLVLSGKVHIINEDYWGNRNIIYEIKESEIFGEAFACTQNILPVSVISIQKSKVMFIDFNRITKTCSFTASVREILIRNLAIILSKNNIILTSKIEHMSKRNTREKLLSYLSEQANIAKSSKFSIPFNRQQLADYLCIDRSAMSSELSKLKSEGIIKYKKEQFELLKS